MKITTPTWFKILLQVLTVIVFCTGFIPLFYVMEALTNLPYLISIFCMSLFLFYWAYLGYELTQFRNVEIEINENMKFITFLNDTTQRTVEFGKIRYKLKSFARITYLYEKDTNEKLAVFDYDIPRGEELVEWLPKHITRR